MSFILVKELGKEREYGLDLKLVAGKKGLQKKIADSRIHKIGLALAGFTDHVQPHRIGLLGNTELSYLKALPTKEREKVIKKICSLEISCFVFTATQSIPKSLIRDSEAIFSSSGRQSFWNNGYRAQQAFTVFSSMFSASECSFSAEAELERANAHWTSS
jgi:hypothetical protein